MSEEKLGAGKYFRFLREKKSLWLIAAALILGTVLIIYGNYSGGTVPVSASVSSESADSAERSLEARVKSLCEQVGGVSHVSVMLTLESLTEQVYAQNIESSDSGVRLEYIQTGSSGTQNPVLTKELLPRVRGVAIVCSGGDDANIQLKLTKLISSLFGIPTSAVNVVGGK